MLIAAWHALAGSAGPGAGAAVRGYRRGMRISGVLIDIDGVLTVSWQPLPGQ